VFPRLRTFDFKYSPAVVQSKAMKVTMDKAGRITLPKRIREEMHLAAGATLELESVGKKITLRTIRSKATLAQEFGIWVYQGGPTNDSIPDLIDRVREERLRDLI
jgi:AbrB family looped-hinge helix DNA binding protein